VFEDDDEYLHELALTIPADCDTADPAAVGLYVSRRRGTRNDELGLEGHGEVAMYWSPVRGLILAAVALSAAQVMADDSVEPRIVARGPERSAPVTPFVFDGDVRDLPPPIPWKPGDPIRAIPQRFYPVPGAPALPDGEAGVLEVEIDDLALAARAARVMPGDDSAWGMGRELFGVFRANARSAEEGASPLL